MSVVHQFSNTVQHMSQSHHGHPSSYQGTPASLAVESDVEKRIQASVAKNGIRIQEFFIDFDKLRKGICGESAVSYNFHAPNIMFFSSVLVLELFNFTYTKTKSLPYSTNIKEKTAVDL